MNRKLSRSALLLALFSSLALASRITLADDEEKEEKLVVRVYRIVDLVAPAPNYPYEGTYVPGADPRSVRSMTTVGMGGGMGTSGMGGGMGGMGGTGGGMFQVPDKLAQISGPTTPATHPPQGNEVRAGALGRGGTVLGRGANRTQISAAQLVEAITDTIDPETWDDAGGPGRITPLGGALVILQTETVHAKVQEFLKALQRESGTLRTLSVRADWLALDNDQLAKLTASEKSAKASPDGQAVNAEALAELRAETQRYAGRITCLNGQTVHIISGKLETALQGAIPVVGTGIGYQPLLLRPHYGALLQVTPTVLPADNAVLVDLQSSILRDGAPAPPVRLGASRDDHSVQVDRMNSQSQQFSTSLRAPLGKPILAGGMTFKASDESGDDEQLYLVIEIRAASE